MKLCIVTETYPPEVNGVALSLHRIGRGLEALGHAVSIVRPRPAAHREHPAGTNEVRVRGLPFPGYKGLRMGLFCGRALLKRWRRDRPDILYVATEGPLGRSAIWAGRRLGIPVTSGFHTNFHEYMKHYRVPGLSKAAARMLRAVHNRTRCTFAPSETLIEELRGMGIHNPRLLPRGVDTGRFDPAKRDPDLRRSWGAERDDQVVAVFVSRIAAEKNIQLLVRAFDRVKQRLPDAVCVLVGDGPERARLEREHPGLIFAGMQRGEALARHYASGDLFLFPSTTETFGNVVLEALASGLVNVAYDYAAPRKHIRDEGNGFLAPLDDDEAYLAAVDRALDARERWPEMRAAARAAAEETGWEAIVSRFAEDLEEERLRDPDNH